MDFTVDSVNVAVISVAGVTIASMFFTFDAQIVMAAIAAITTLLGVNRFFDKRSESGPVTST